jgi:hypothetical protein
MPHFASPHLAMPGLGQGHNQKKDTHSLDFDVTLWVVKMRLHLYLFHDM